MELSSAIYSQSSAAQILRPKLCFTVSIPQRASIVSSSSPPRYLRMETQSQPRQSISCASSPSNNVSPATSNESGQFWDRISHQVLFFFLLSFSDSKSCPFDLFRGSSSWRSEASNKGDECVSEDQLGRHWSCWLFHWNPFPWPYAPCIYTVFLICSLGTQLFTAVFLICLLRYLESWLVFCVSWLTATCFTWLVWCARKSYWWRSHRWPSH